MDYDHVRYSVLSVFRSEPWGLGGKSRHACIAVSIVCFCFAQKQNIFVMKQGAQRKKPQANFKDYNCPFQSHLTWAMNMIFHILHFIVFYATFEHT